MNTFQNISCYCLTIPCIALFTLISIFQNISCYCLTGRKGDKNGRNIISKHLMLLFNFYVDADYLKETKFQNISCYCLTTSTFHIITPKTISKHLMLLFNNNMFFISFTPHPISKHLMLLFNALIPRESRILSIISKHLMLLFNQEAIVVSVPVFPFQNISCYCLTMQSAQQKIAANLFQNISCYCLTKKYTLAGCQEKNFKTSHVIV